nr:DUF6705 family protein [Elizabethkingia bruuniana]
MKNFIITTLLFSSISCYSQTVGLKEVAASEDKSLKNVSYLKDSDRSLNKFEGTWKGEYNDKKYEFKFVKKTQENYTPKRDVLIGRFIVKDLAGNILYSTLDKPDNDTGLSGLNFQKDLKIYKINYAGKDSNCGEYGTVYIYFKDPNNLKEMSLLFLGSGDITVKEKCKDYSPLILTEKTLKLTKQ